MARPPRIEFPGAFYHVTSRGDGRGDVYLDDIDRQRFLEVLSEVVERFNWVCHAYCLMDNHYHLLIETPEGNLSLGMRQLNGVFTQRFNRRHQRVGHVFQGRYKAILLQEDAYLLELCRYIVLNPVRAQMVQQPDDWRWSSFAATAGIDPPPQWLSIKIILAAFSDDNKQAVLAYRRFVLQGIDKASPWSDLRHQIYLGDDGFVQAMQRKIAADADLREMPAGQTARLVLPLDSYLEVAGSRNEAIADAYRGGGRSMAQIADHFGLHYSSVSKIIKQFENSQFKT
ncbi:MAG: transposase [Immundisolibacteraceae bacterium]|nr:transposase [Immundisolibacteraceae bacterium]